MTLTTSPPWGLRHDITPCFGARLVQEGNRLHYLGDRPGSTARSLPCSYVRWTAAFRHLSDRWKPRCVPANWTRIRHIRREKDGLICEADTRGSCGYVYVSVYPAPQPA